MTVRTALSEGVRLLRKHVESPYLDSVLLLSHAYGITKERVLSSFPDAVPSDVEKKYREYLGKRGIGVPVSYIRGCKEFFSLDFYIDERVLVPRPETEIIVDAALAVARGDKSVVRVHDCCTGSGCVGIAIKHEQPHLEITVSDVSADALEVFKINSQNILGQLIPYFQCDLMPSTADPFDMVVANPPYLCSKAVNEMAESGWAEPAIALDGGDDGLCIFLRLLEQCRVSLRSGGFLLMEADPEQMVMLKKMCVQSGFSDIILYEDFAGCKRVLQSRRNRH